MTPSKNSASYISFDLACCCVDVDASRLMFQSCAEQCGLRYGRTISVSRYEKLDIRHRVFGPVQIMSSASARLAISDLFSQIEETLLGTKGVYLFHREAGGTAPAFEIVGPPPDRALPIPNLKWVCVAYTPEADRQRELHHMFNAVKWPAAGFVDTEIRCLTELESGNATKEVQPRVQA